MHLADGLRGTTPGTPSPQALIAAWRERGRAAFRPNPPSHKTRDSRPQSRRARRPSRLWHGRTGGACDPITKGSPSTSEQPIAWPFSLSSLPGRACVPPGGSGSATAGPGRLRLGPLHEPAPGARPLRHSRQPRPRHRARGPQGRPAVALSRRSPSSHARPDPIRQGRRRHHSEPSPSPSAPFSASTRKAKTPALRPAAPGASDPFVLDPFGVSGGPSASCNPLDALTRQPRYRRGCRHPRRRPRLRPARQQRGALERGSQSPSRRSDPVRPHAEKNPQRTLARVRELLTLAPDAFRRCSGSCRGRGRRGTGRARRQPPPRKVRPRGLRRPFLRPAPHPFPQLPPPCRHYGPLRLRLRRSEGADRDRLSRPAARSPRRLRPLAPSDCRAGSPLLLAPRSAVLPCSASAR